MRLGLELHPEKTKRVNLYDGAEGFDFLGCHLRKRLSGSIWEQQRKRVYFLNREPSQRSMKRVRSRVRELTPRGRCHADMRDVIVPWPSYSEVSSRAAFGFYADLPRRPAVRRMLRWLRLLG